LKDLEDISLSKAEVRLDADSALAMIETRKVVEDILSSGRVAYGINTGFGFLSDVVIPPGDARKLQVNLLRSHACGVGEPLPEEIVRIIMFLRAHVLAKGFSGVRPVICETIAEMLNRGVHPVIPSKGSVGASGDLAPLAHLSLVLIGEGAASYKGVVLSGADAMKRAGIEPVQLEAKEGISLINGTQVMTALGIRALLRLKRILAAADIAGAMSLEACMGTAAAFSERIQNLRPYSGQKRCAEDMRRLLEGSEIGRSHSECKKVQDPYSFRCIPQVHGAVYDAVDYVENVVLTEIDSVTDNPLVFPDGEVISGGNFHGEPVAIALDFLAIAVSELASISERRIEQLVNPHLSSGLPAFLTPQSGLNSGFMIAQVAAASLVSENKVLCHPASVDSIPSSANREDHVSMGVTAGLKALQVVENVETVIAVELLCAAQGLEFRKPLKPGIEVLKFYERIRSEIAPLTDDRNVSDDITKIKKILNEYFG